MLPNALRAVSFKATSYSELEVLHVPETVFEKRLNIIVTLFGAFLCSETNKSNTSV